MVKDKELHLHRILSLLGVWQSRKIIIERKYHGLLQPKWNHYTQWKWFFKDLGKHTCILSLLPFAQMALHISQTPLPEQHKHEMENYDSLQNKIDLVIIWSEKPTNQNKAKLAEKLATSIEYSGFGLPTKAAEAFINNLLSIIVTERKFYRQVEKAFYYLQCMGYSSYFVESVFKAEVLAIYQDKLGDYNQTKC